MKQLIGVVVSGFISICATAQDYSAFQATLDAFYEIAQLPGTDRERELETLWATLTSNNQIPLIAEDSVAFLYKGEAESVAWLGDFNAWGYDKKLKGEGKKVPGLNVWMLKASFPKDARLDYKLFINGRTWILDPENPFQQWSGVGGGSPNSELRMPDWKQDSAIFFHENIAHGKLTSDILFHSRMLDYQIMYSVYLPPVDLTDKLPVVYVMDGYEYLHPKMGNMTTVLDNLIGTKTIEPIVAIFIDHREPTNRANNRRMEELAMNENYMTFFIEEFIPEVEPQYPIQNGPKSRAVMGAGVGGLNAAFFAFSRPDVFGMLGMQSPTFHTRPQIYTLCDNPNNPPTRISMTSGVINDGTEGSRRMKDIFESNACVYFYREVNEGPSWGNWRNLEDDILIDFFSAK